MPNDRILDVGCGIGIIAGNLGAEETTIIGVDIYFPYLLHYPWLKVCGDARALPVRGKFDVVIALDIVEHLAREEAERLINELEKMKIRHLFVFTPEGFVFNNPLNVWQVPGGDHFQQHKCGFESTWFLNNGFDIIYAETYENVYTGKEFTNILYIK